MVKKSNKNNFRFLFLLVLFTILFQLFVTYFFTNTKEFSNRALIRNLSIVISIYLVIFYKNILFLIIPFLVEILLEYAKLKGFHMEKYIATKYQYNDYWRNINVNDDIFSNFSEGNYDQILGFDTRDHSQENLIKILNWSKKTYNNSLISNSPYLVDINGNYHNGDYLKKITDDAKFKLICDICKIKPNMRILEIGFGEGDFLMYIRDHYNISPVGVSISNEQVNLVKKRGFNAYCMNSWDMDANVLGKFDLILQCGNLEYIKCSGESNEVYTKFCNIINSLLKKDGKYFITCIHFNDKYRKFNLYDNLNCYLLWSGNDGSYPYGKDGFTKYAEKAGLIKLYQEERTNDYFITTVIFMSYLQCMKGKCVNSITYISFLDALYKTIAAPYYIHTYLCYSPTKDFYNLPWQWEFIPQNINNNYISPVTLEYILMKKY